MTANLYAALVQAQAAVQPVGKGSFNEHHRYKYASGDDIVAEGRRALNGAGLALFSAASRTTIHPYTWEDEKGQSHEDIQLRLEIEFRLVHTSGEALDYPPFSIPVMPEKGRPLDKAEAGARTYALSYFLRELLLIPRVDATDEADPDRRDDRTYEPRRQVAPRQPPRTTPPRSAPPAPPAPPRRRSATQMIRDGMARFEQLTSDLPSHHVADAFAELDALGSVVTDPDSAPEGARRDAVKALGDIVTRLAQLHAAQRVSEEEALAALEAAQAEAQESHP